MTEAVADHYPFETLPDYLRTGLALVFVGLNPGSYSVQHGHYFARPTSRFWPAFSRSRLSVRVRAAWARERLSPEDDAGLLTYDIGFSDVVKVPSRNAAELTSALYKRWAPELLGQLQACQPQVACFHGAMAYRAFLRYALGMREASISLGPQPVTIRPTHLFVVPNPSPANAHFSLDDQVAWYDRLADYLVS